MTGSFPKIIWQTHNHKKEWLPDHLNKIAATWKNLNPGWDYRYVNQVERDEKVRQYPEIYEMYKYRPPIIQSDIWRIIVTYEEGGCYNDMDSVCVKPLDYMLDGIRGDPEMVTVPISGHSKFPERWTGNSHNYIVKAKSPILKITLDKTSKAEATNNLHPTYPFSTFVEEAYSYPNVDKTFNAAIHSKDYKLTFPYKKHIIDYYGKEMNYIDFLEQNNLSENL